jgi:hypothetical protein
MKTRLNGLLPMVVLCVLLAGLLQVLCTGCQTQRYDTVVNVYGAAEAPAALACGAELPAATAEAPTARGTLRARALQAVVVNVSDNLGDVAKPIEISPARNPQATVRDAALSAGQSPQSTQYHGTDADAQTSAGAPGSAASPPSLDAVPTVALTPAPTPAPGAGAPAASP